MRIGIDTMGGDFAPGSALGGAILARESLPGDVEIVLIGDKEIMTRYGEEHQLNLSGFSIVHTPDSVEMSDSPLKVFKEKPRAGLFLAQHMLVSGELDGFCSAGNTGAMMVGAMQIVNVIPGIIRPAIAATIPQLSGIPGFLLDVGLNPDARPDVLYQYGAIGTIFSSLVHQIKEPKVALLNVGAEEGKGNMLVRSAYQLMKENSDYHFIGNVEANEMFVSDRAQVIVTDGFVGNVMLKQAEAFYKILSLKSKGDDYFEMFNFENFGGTPVLGVNAPMIIGHGVSNEKAIKNMLLQTARVVEAGLINKIKEELN